jgi:hypothetical protein
MARRISLKKNTKEVARRSASEVDAGGIVGIRVHDDADVHIAYLTVRKGPG